MQRFKELFVIVFLLTLVLSGCISAMQVPPIRRGDLVGKWVADYAQYKDVVIHNAKETIVLHSDGTFTQEFLTGWGYQERNSGQWRVEKVSECWSRVYLQGAVYYLSGFRVAHDSTVKIDAWDDVMGQHVTIVGGRGMIILYATRLLSKSESPCGREYELVLQHLPIGDLDAPEYVTFHRDCAPSKSQ